MKVESDRKESTMSYEFLHNLFLVSAVLAGIMFVVSVILFFALNIRNAFDILTGRIIRRENAKRRQIGQQIANPKEKKKKTSAKQQKEMEQAKKEYIATQTYQETSLLNAGETETMILTAGTEVLNEKPARQTTIPLSDKEVQKEFLQRPEETDMLVAGFMSEDGTMLLDERKTNSVVQIEREIIFIHTNERITM